METDESFQEQFEVEMRNALSAGLIQLPMTEGLIDHTYKTLDSVSVNGELREKCIEKALAADCISNLRSIIQRRGFEALSFGDYLRRLTYLAGFSVRDILPYFGLNTEMDISELDQPSTHTVRFAQAIGISLRQFIVHIKLSLLQQNGVLFANAFHSRTNSTNGAFSLIDTEDQIHELEKNLKSEIVHQLHNCEIKIRDIFKVNN
jgi:hypothetical protein